MLSESHRGSQGSERRRRPRTRARGSASVFGRRVSAGFGPARWLRRSCGRGAVLDSYEAGKGDAVQRLEECGGQGLEVHAVAYRNGERARLQ